MTPRTSGRRKGGSKRKSLGAPAAYSASPRGLVGEGRDALVTALRSTQAQACARPRCSVSVSFSFQLMGRNTAYWCKRGRGCLWRRPGRACWYGPGEPRVLARQGREDPGSGGD